MARELRRVFALVVAFAFAMTIALTSISDSPMRAVLPSDSWEGEDIRKNGKRCKTIS